MKTNGCPRFYKLLEEMALLHSRKNSDYATDEEPLSNLLACEKINIPAWKGVIVRLQDKWDRITKICNKKEPAVKDESMIDTLMDNAVYSLLAIILIEREESSV